MTGGSIEDLLESVVSSSHYASRVRGTEERVKDCSKCGFSGTTAPPRVGTRRVSRLCPFPQGLFRFTKRVHLDRISFMPNTSRYRVGGCVSSLGKPPTHGGFFMLGFSGAAPAF